MRKAFTILAIASFALLACQKESALVENQNKQDAVQSNIPTEIVCEVSEAPTKTQYAGNTTFGWTNGDQVRMPLVKRTSGIITDCNFFTFTSTSGGSASASFTRNGTGAGEDMEGYDPNPGGADATWTNMGYLVYPHTIFNSEHSGDYPVVTLPVSYTYNSTNPLDGGFVPMIGRKVGDTYKFSTALGFLKSQITDLNSATTKISLSSVANSVSGKFAVSDESSTVAKIAAESATTGNNAVSLTMTSPTADETFYFPVPVGVFAANDLSLKISEESGEKIVVRTKRIQKALTIARNEVLSIPALAMTYPNSVAIQYSATDAPLIKRTLSSGYYLRFCVRSSSTHDLSEYVEGMKFTDTGADKTWQLTGATNKTDGTALSASGKYYLHYMILNTSAELSTLGLASLDDSRIVEYGTIPFYFLNSDPSNIFGTYYINNNSNYVITISDTDDNTKGDVILSHYKGGTYDVDMKTYGDYDSYNGRILFNAPSKTPNEYDYALGIGTTTTSDWQFTFETHEKLKASGYLKLFQKVSSEWTDLSHSFTNPYIMKQ